MRNVDLDKSGMLGHVLALADQCAQAWEWGLGWRVPASFFSARRLLVLGVGGSAIGADLAAGIAGSGLKRPLQVNRTYDLPGWVDRETAVLVSSYSGNTEETLSAAAQAARRTAKVAAITSGGKLADWAAAHRFPLLRIPTGLPPRAAVGYMTFIPLGLLARGGWVSRPGLKVEAACAGLGRYLKTAAGPAKKLAAKMLNKLPVLYGAAGGWEGIAYRWRTQLEENSKTLAFHHVFPESTHNEISGWVEPKGLMRHAVALFLTDPVMHPRILRRMEFVRRIVVSQGAQAQEISVSGSTVTERMLRLVALGDLASVYLAFLYKTDPTPVVRVEALKAYLR